MSVLQYMLLFGSESWAVIHCILRALGSFHNWVGINILSRMRRCWNGHWEYSLISKALSEAVLETIGGYISFRHSSGAQYISTRPIFDIAVTKEQRSGSPESMLWWEQEEVWFGNEGRGTEELELN